MSTTGIDEMPNSSTLPWPSRDGTYSLPIALRNEGQGATISDSAKLQLHGRTER